MGGALSPSPFLARESLGGTASVFQLRRVDPRMLHVSFLLQIERVSWWTILVAHRRNHVFIVD